MDVLQRIDQQVKNNPIVIYMKGTPQFPQCGFSMRAAAALQECGVPFAYVNVLQDPEIFQNLPRYADWPTFPQIYIDGELIGGCDITLELHGKGDLKPMMEAAVAKGATDDQASGGDAA
jgi:monothiol glutaredoxin